MCLSVRRSELALAARDGIGKKYRISLEVVKLCAGSKPKPGRDLRGRLSFGLWAAHPELPLEAIARDMRPTMVEEHDAKGSLGEC